MELILFIMGGRLYTWIEILWRGYTHWSMFILGGACFVIMGLLNEYKFVWQQSLIAQAVISASVITVLEFVTGCIVNLWLGWQIWDYSELPFNLMGQICLYFFLLWILFSIVGIIVDDWIRYLIYLVLHKHFPKMQKREMPRYNLLGI